MGWVGSLDCCGGVGWKGKWQMTHSHCACWTHKLWWLYLVLCDHSIVKLSTLCFSAILCPFKNSSKDFVRRIYRRNNIKSSSWSHFLKYFRNFQKCLESRCSFGLVYFCCCNFLLNLNSNISKEAKTPKALNFRIPLKINFLKFHEFLGPQRIFLSD